MIDNAIFCRHLTTGSPLSPTPDIASPKKKKKKNKENEGQDNPAYVQDNNVLT
jgi:hypothetical protein